MRTANVSTDKKLLEALNRAAKRTLSKEEIESQRISFIWAGLPKKTAVTKADIKKSIG